MGPKTCGSLTFENGDQRLAQRSADAGRSSVDSKRFY